MGNKMSKNNKNKLWIGIAIGAVLGCITLGAFFVIFFMFFLFGGPAEVETDVTKYQETLAKYEYAKTAYLVFPEEIPESAKDVDFYFSYQDTWNVPTQEVYLKCTYDEADYQSEIDRLENVKKRYGSTVRTLLRDEEGRYSYPVYIAQDGYWDNFEYAMLTGENEITYIYTAMMNADDLKKVDQKLLPSDFDERQMEYTGIEGYTIYLQKVVYCDDGTVDYWNCDYTRDEVSEVTKNHWVELGYNTFYVTTYLDEQDRERIKECSYYYYESQHDSVYGLPEVITYNELTGKGYLYKDLELSKDKSKALVTYYDGTEEKMMEYEIPDV